MSATALHPDTSAVIFPLEGGATRGVCRDGQCRGHMAAVRQSDRAVSHWRHLTSDAERGCSSQVNPMTEWHRGWQQECTDRKRVEFVVTTGSRRRRADVVTAWEPKYAIEFQHSPIKNETARDRERHYRGRLVWVLDLTLLDSPFGGIDTYQGQFRWVGVPGFIMASKAIAAVDTGERVHVLPTDRPVERWVTSSGEAHVPVQRVTNYTRQGFAAAWVNGTTTPLEVQDRLRGETPKAAPVGAQDATTAAVRGYVYRDDTECRYVGPVNVMDLPPRPDPVTLARTRADTTCHVCGSTDTRRFMNFHACASHAPEQLRLASA